jgi:hypothetical protein
VPVEQRTTVFAETENGNLTLYATHIIGMGQFSWSYASLRDGKSWTGFKIFWINARAAHVKVVLNILFL